MFIRIFDCVTTDHNPALVALAMLVALFSGFSFFRILDHAGARDGRAQAGWSLMAAVAAGGGIWSAHFIAMLGFQPHLAISYDVGLTLLSAVQAMTFAGVATLLLLSKRPALALAGALVLAGAIGTMHFTGMRAMVFPGSLVWDASLVASALVLAGSLTTAAVLVARGDGGLAKDLAAACLFGAAVCGLHFTSMAAAVLKVDPSHRFVEGNLSEFLLGLAVALVVGSIVIFSLVIIAFDRRARTADADARQIRSILESAQIGIVVCQRGAIISANRTFGQLAGLAPSDIEGRQIAGFLDIPPLDNRKTRLHEVEAQLTTANGTSMDVAVSVAPVVCDGRRLHLIEVRDIRDQKRLRGQMLHLANHDALTGLPNRRLLDAELRAEAAAGNAFDLLWIDLDRFKQVNDTHGHAVGDMLLRLIAQRFRSALDARHLLARVGGDEFVILFRPSPGQDSAAQAAERLVDATLDPLVVDDKVLQVGASIGLASYPADAASAEELMRLADAALYAAKKTGRGCWHRADVEAA